MGLVGSSKVDVGPIAPFVVIFDLSGKVVATDGQLDGHSPVPPSGVLESARLNPPNAVTWQPRDGVRIASVSLPWGGGTVLAGRSLREVEQREDDLPPHRHPGVARHPRRARYGRARCRLAVAKGTCLKRASSAVSTRVTKTPPRSHKTNGLQVAPARRFRRTDEPYGPGNRRCSDASRRPADKRAVSGRAHTRGGRAPLRRRASREMPSGSALVGEQGGTQRRTAHESPPYPPGRFRHGLGTALWAVEATCAGHTALQRLPSKGLRPNDLHVAARRRQPFRFAGNASVWAGLCEAS